MSKITIDRALVDQVLDALDSDSPDIQLRAAIALRVRLLQLQQAEPEPEPEPLAEPAGLIDDLCLLEMGWMSEEEGQIYRAARGRVVARACEARRLRQIELLKARVAKLEGRDE